MATIGNSCFWLAKILNILETRCPNVFFNFVQMMCMSFSAKIPYFIFIDQAENIAAMGNFLFLIGLTRKKYLMKYLK